VPGPHSRTRSLRKKCGHPNDKKIADAHDMAAKVVAAATHILVGRQAMLGAQELASRPKHPAHLGQRRGGLWNAA